MYHTYTYQQFIAQHWTEADDWYSVWCNDDVMLSVIDPLVWSEGRPGDQVLYKAQYHFWLVYTRLL